MSKGEVQIEARAFMSGFDAVVAQCTMDPNITIDAMLSNIGLRPDSDGHEYDAFTTLEGNQNYRKGAHAAIKSLIAMEVEASHV